MIADECSNKTSPIWLVDATYTTANSVLCSAACVCYGDRTLWSDKYDFTQPGSSSASTFGSLTNSATAIAATYGMVNDT